MNVRPTRHVDLKTIVTLDLALWIMIASGIVSFHMFENHRRAAETAQVHMAHAAMQQGRARSG